MSKRLVTGSGGGGGCFLGHTLVRVPEGLKRIDELAPGDLVLSFDDCGDIHQAKVLKVHVHEGEKVTRYRLWGGAVLDATPNHWVLNQFNAFVEIDSLGPDDCLVDENGHLRPIVAKSDFGVGTVYNLTVEGHHTFIAGGIRVHNAGLGLGPVSGAGGGGGSKGSGGGTTYTPYTVGDSLNSTQYANLIDLISEGEIQGLKNGHKSIFINNTPLQNADNSYNFKNVTVYERTGTQAQDCIPISSAVEDEKPVGVQVTANTPVVRTVVDSNVDAVRITITVPQLQAITDQGDIVGASASLDIYVQYNGGGYVLALSDTISGRSGDQYQRNYLINLTGAFPVDIKVVRTTADSTTPKLVNAFSWSSYTELVYAKLRYPNSALIGMRVDAEQFSSIPQRSYLVRGIKVQIPSNATVDSATGRLIYSGIWNGTFGAAQWCSDPAWILWDLLTSTRYGFGDHIQAAQLDKWAFYAASQYSSTLVPDGFGGTEPRFSCNVVIQTAEEAFKLINDMCSVFRAMPYWSTGALTVAQDKPADPAYLFTLANVSEAGFSYQSSSQKTRPTVAVVSYLDLATREIAYEVVEDTAAIAKYGVVSTQISAFACTSRGQAARIGEWLLYAEQHENEVISFTASIDAGVLVRPGQVIEVADPVRAGERRGGRIISATKSAITVDDATGITAVPGSTLSVILPDGSVQTQPISGIGNNVITVTSAFSLAPNPYSVWVVQTADLQTSTWRVLSVQEQDGAQYAITALAYNASKYDYIERGAPLQQRDATNLNEIPAAPTNLQITEALYSYQGQVRAKVIATWRSVVGVNQYEVRWRKDQGNWSVVTQQGPDYEVLDITPGVFDFKVFSLNAAGKSSTDSLDGSITALGKTAAPSDVTGFSFALDASLGVTLTWSPVSDLDLSQYEIRKGADWASGTVVTRVAATSYKVGLLEPATATYWIKALDTSGIYSANAVSTAVTISVPGTPVPTASVQGDTAVLTWPAITASYVIDYYAIRTSSGALGQSKTTTFSVPITWTGSRSFWVKAVDLAGNQSAEGLVTVTIAAAPAPTVTGSVSGESATLSWNEVNGTTLTRSYEIRFGATLQGSTLITTLKSTSYSFKVNWTGSRTFWVSAVDGNGNVGAAGFTAITIASAGAPTVSSAFAGEAVVLSWNGVTGSLPTAAYQVRQGGSFVSAAVIATINSTSYSLAVDWAGSQTFWVAAVDVNGTVGAGGSTVVTVSTAAAPTITSSFGSNSLTLNWTQVAGSVPTATYEIRRGTTYATATVLANIKGTSYTLRADWTGAQTFWVAAVDTAGNLGTAASATATVVAAGPPVTTSSFAGRDMVLSWTSVKGTLDTASYVVKRGALFASATTLATIQSTAYTLRADWGGTQKFWVAAIDVNGTVGTPDDIDVIVTLPPAPTITQQVIDNNVLLRWNDVTATLPIENYELRKGASWATATSIGTKQGGFTTIFETQSGTYTYWLAGIDSAGNYGTPGSINAVVNQPPDYVIQLDQNSTWAGTETNILTDGSQQIVNVNTTETWQSHFTSRGYTTPQDQINAGFTYFLMPSTTTAAYEETFDYGTTLAGTKVSATLTSSNVAGSTTVTPTISVRKLATDPWTDYPGLTEVFVTAFRYFKVRYDFASAGNNDLMLLTNLNVRLDSKIRNDAGTGTANSADVGGTVVNFNVAFVDVQSITVTPATTGAVIAVYDFLDAPNPTSFKVLLFNTSGVRVSGAFSWTARGV